MATAASISARLILDQSEFTSGLNLAQQRLKSFEGSLKTIGSGLTSIGQTMSLAFTVPIVAGAGLASKAFIDLDTQMRNIQSITLDSDENIAALSDRFLEMSTDMNITRDSAAKLAEGFYFISSAGFAGEDGMEVLRVATKAASAGLTDTMVAGNAILAVLNAYGMEAKDAAYVSDVLFKTVDKGVLTFEDLASQLGDIVSTSATLNIGIDEIGSAMSILTRKGISASEAVTALNQFMLQIISPSKKMVETAEDLGVSWEKLNGIVREEGLEAALDYITGFGGDEALLDIFGDNVRALKAVLALAKGGTGDFEEMNLEFMNVTNRTQEAFEQQNKSVAAQMDNFKNKLTALGITLAAIFIPILIQLIDLVKPVIDQLKEASPTTQKWALAILALLAVSGPILLFLGSLLTVGGAVVGIITAISLPIWGLIAIFLLLVAGLVLLFFAWKNNWGGIQQKTFEAIEYIKNIVNTGLQWLADMNAGKLGWMSVTWANSMNLIKYLFQAAINHIRFLFLAFKAAMQGDWYTFGVYLRAMWNNAWAAIGQIFSIGAANIRIAATNLVNALVGIFTRINWDSVGSNIVKGVVNGINSMKAWAQNAIINLGKAMMAAFNGFFGIRSPSTLMEERFKFIAQGANLGWENNFALSPSVVNSQIPMPLASLNSSPISAAQTGAASGQQEGFDYERFARIVASEVAKVRG